MAKKPDTYVCVLMVWVSWQSNMEFLTAATWATFAPAGTGSEMTCPLETCRKINPHLC